MKTISTDQLEIELISEYRFDEINSDYNDAISSLFPRNEWFLSANKYENSKSEIYVFDEEYTVEGNYGYSAWVHVINRNYDNFYGCKTAWVSFGWFSIHNDHTLRFIVECEKTQTLDKCIEEYMNWFKPEYVCDNWYNHLTHFSEYLTSWYDVECSIEM